MRILRLRSGHSADFWVLAWCLLGGTVHAQTDNTDADAAETTEPPVELETITVESAIRTVLPVSELTRSVTVVTEDQVEQQKRIDRSVGEILSKTVPGFSPSTEANSDFGQTLRGRTFLTLIDGIPQSTPLRDGRRSVNSIDADAIEQIEVVRGGTAVYGFGATGGWVNILTKRPQPGPARVRAEVGVKLSTTHVNDSLEWNTNLQTTGRSGKVDYLLNGSYISRGGSFDADGDRRPADPLGAQGGLADTDTYNIIESEKIGVRLTIDTTLFNTGSVPLSLVWGVYFCVMIRAKPPPMGRPRARDWSKTRWPVFSSLKRMLATRPSCAAGCAMKPSASMLVTLPATKGIL